MFYVYDQSDENSGIFVTKEMFGLNALITVNTVDEVLMDKRYQELGVTNLRFPGGSVTEWHFDITDVAGGSLDTAVSSFQGVERKLVPFSDFLEVAARIEASVTLVIPTINGFTQSAGEALLERTYGQRLIDATYLDYVADFIEAAVAKSDTLGVKIDAFEIGNEFWGSGQMTAAEYGKLAAAVSQVTSETLSDLGVLPDQQPDIVVQTISSAGTFSPSSETLLYVDEQTKFIFQPSELAKLDGDFVAGLTEVTVSSQGRSREQARDIISAFEGQNVITEEDGRVSQFDTSGAADAIDGVVNHYYVDRGFASVNTEEQYGFNQLDLWNIELGARDETLPDLEFYITEWNTRKNGAIEDANNRGLQQVSMNVEIFYEMVTHDVTAANFWPVLFNYSNSGTLVFNSADSLTLVGEGFSLMSESLVGLRPMLDFRVAGEVSVHGYGDADTLVYFLSERSGSENRMHLDLSEVMQLDGEYFQVSWTELWDGGSSGIDEMARPVISNTTVTEYLARDEFSDFLLTMQAWSTIRMDVVVTDRRSDGNGTDTLIDIELLDFDIDLLDGPFDLTQFGGTTGLSGQDFESFIELYIAYFNRAPDAVGLNFWGTAFAEGTSLEEMATLFIDQEETAAAYPGGTTNDTFATTVYNNVLGRTPDQEGFNFWVGQLDSENVSRDQFILEVLRGVQPGSPDRSYLDDKVDIGAYFAVHKGMSDTDNASSAMALFDGTEASINAAIAAIDGHYADAQDPANGEFLMPVIGVLDDPFQLM